VLLYVSVGCYALWETGWLVRIGWILPVIWGFTWILAKLWRVAEPTLALQPAEWDFPRHWTERDRLAVTVVREHQATAVKVTVDDLTNPHVYLNSALQLAMELAPLYGKPAADPWNGITVLEATAALRLALEDTEHWVRQTIPGSETLTIGHWKTLGKAAEWLPHVQTGVSVISALLNPINFLISRATLTPVLTELQREAVTSIYQRFIRQAGFYLIEMYSGRLRSGPEVYRQLFSNVSTATPLAAPTYPGSTPAPELRPGSLCLAVMGQVKSGKSSLINGLIGERQAATDILPLTREIQRYTLQIPDSTETLTLLDTPGYAESGASRQQLAEIQKALELADLIVLVLGAHTPAKKADQIVLQQLRQHLQERPHLTPPPVLAVVTHVDVLSPVREWSPPYEWRSGSRPKEESIRGAVEYVRQLFGRDIVDVVPVASPDEPLRQWGVGEELIPAMLPHLDASRTAAVLKAYHGSLGRNRLGTLLGQFRNSGATLLSWWIQERLLPQLTGNNAPTTPPESPSQTH
jgi:predicted GTPase